MSDAVPIKFRIWDNGTKKMYEVFSFCKDYIKVIVDGNVYKWNRANFEPIMQYTGIPDKSGKDIYDGDYVMYSNSQESGIGRIERWKGGFVVVWIEQVTDKPTILDALFYYACSAEWEVIGNVYQTDAAKLHKLSPT